LYVWTGTKSDGTKGGNYCTHNNEAWKTNDQWKYGNTGNSKKSNTDWSNHGTVTCSQKRRLYCIEDIKPTTPSFLFQNNSTALPNGAIRLNCDMNDFVGECPMFFTTSTSYTQGAYGYDQRAICQPGFSLFLKSELPAEPVRQNLTRALTTGAVVWFVVSPPSLPTRIFAAGVITAVNILNFYNISFEAVCSNIQGQTQGNGYDISYRIFKYHIP